MTRRCYLLSCAERAEYAVLHPERGRRPVCPYHARHALDLDGAALDRLAGAKAEGGQSPPEVVEVGGRGGNGRRLRRPPAEGAGHERRCGAEGDHTGGEVDDGDP